MAVRASALHSPWDIVTQAPHTKTAIFQVIVNKCQSFYKGRNKGNIFTDTRLLSFASPHFLFPLFTLFVIVITRNLPAACHAFLFSVGQDLEVNHLLFSPFSQLNCYFGRSFQKRETSLYAKRDAWWEKHSWLKVPWLLMWPKEAADFETEHEFKVEEYQTFI